MFSGRDMSFSAPFGCAGNVFRLFFRNVIVTTLILAASMSLTLYLRVCGNEDIEGEIDKHGVPPKRGASPFPGIE